MESHRFRCESWLQRLTVPWPWASYSTTINLSVLPCKPVTWAAPVSQTSWRASCGHAAVRVKAVNALVATVSPLQDRGSTGAIKLVSYVTLAVPAQRCGLVVSAGLSQWCSSSARQRPVPLWVHNPRHGVELLLAEVCTAGTTHPSGLGALVHTTGNCLWNTRGSVTCGLALVRSQRAVLVTSFLCAGWLQRTPGPGKGWNHKMDQNLSVRIEVNQGVKISVDSEYKVTSNF